MLDLRDFFFLFCKADQEFEAFAADALFSLAQRIRLVLMALRAPSPNWLRDRIMQGGRAAAAAESAFIVRIDAQ